MPDNQLLRTWEIAGASHVPAYSTATDPRDFRATLGGIRAREFGPSEPYDCVNPGPSRVPSWAVFHAAYERLDRWGRGGHAPALATSGTQLVRDGRGIVRGGIRLPSVAVPTELNDGVNAPANLDNPLNAFCVLYGTNRPFAQEVDRTGYRVRVAAQLARLVRDGFVLPRDVPALYREAVTR